MKKTLTLTTLAITGIFFGSAAVADTYESGVDGANNKWEFISRDDGSGESTFDFGEGSNPRFQTDYTDSDGMYSGSISHNQGFKGDPNESFDS